MYSFSRCSVELRDTNTNCVIGSLAICYGIRLWLVWAVVYVVIRLRRLTKYMRRQPFKRGVHLHPPYPPPGSATAYKDINSLENIQKFALRVCCKNWNLGYSELLDVCKVPSLENQRLYWKLSHMFKIVNNLCYFPPEIVVQRPTVPYFSRPSLLQQPFCRTSAFAHSFVPDTIRKWNCLPIELTCSHTLHSFQSSLNVFTW